MSTLQVTKKELARQTVRLLYSSFSTPMIEELLEIGCKSVAEFKGPVPEEMTFLNQALAEEIARRKEPA